MAKIGVGVGEEFPVDDAQPPKSPPPGEPPPREPWHHRGGWHFALHVLARVALIALLIGGIAWLFSGHGFHGYAYGPYAFHPMYHRGFFFPFFPVLLIVLLVGFAFRRHHYYGPGCYGYGMRRWHDEMHRDRGERT
jgi:hypothetical protein